MHLRTVEHRLQILHEFQTHTLPDATPVALGLLARRLGIARPAGRAPPRDLSRAATRASPAPSHRAFTRFFRERPAPAPPRPRAAEPASRSGATGFADPERARQNLRLILEGRPLVPYAGALRARRWSGSSRRCSTRSGRAPIPTRR